MKKIWTGLVLALLMVGCQTVRERAEPLPIRLGGHELPTASLVEALRTLPGTRVQAVEGSWGDRNFQCTCVLKGDGTNLTAVVVSAQVRILTITLTPPHAIRCDQVPQIPRAFEPEYALVDFACVNLDTATLQRVLAPVGRVTDDGTTRSILTASGELYARYTRDATGGGTFENLFAHYTYRIKNLQ